jgi:uncharacterized membrane protein
MNQELELRSFFVPLWLLILGVPLILMGVLILISTCIVYIMKKISEKDFS